jgi:hypothetical protein
MTASIEKRKKWHLARGFMTLLHQRRTPSPRSGTEVTGTVIRLR